MSNVDNFRPAAKEAVEAYQAERKRWGKPIGDRDYVDPSKVKAGDTVTVENGETTVRGPVTNIEHAPHTEIVVGFAIQNIGWRYIEADVVAQQDAGVWTLTAHQPVDALADTVHNVLALPNYESSHATAHVVEKIRERFVVIDPAEVDVDALGDAYVAHSQNGRWDSNALRAVLAEVRAQALRDHAERRNRIQWTHSCFKPVCANCREVRLRREERDSLLRAAARLTATTEEPTA